MQQQHLFHFARVNVGATRNHHILAAVVQGDKTVFIHRAQVAGPQPATSQGLLAGVQVAPIAAHHHIATHQHLAHLAAGHGFAVVVGYAHFNPALGHPHTAQPRVPAWVGGVGQHAAGQGGDGHGRFALAINLDKPLPHHLQRPAHVGRVHGASAVNQGFEPIGAVACVFQMVHQALDHGRRGKQHQLPPALGRIHQLGRVKPARRRNQVASSPWHLCKVVQTSAMRQGRGVHQHIVRCGLVHTLVIAGHHGHQVAVAHHHPFGAAGGARCVKQPSQIGGVALLQRQPGPLQQLLRLVAVVRQQWHPCWQIGCQCPQRRQVLAAGNQHPGLCVVGNPGHFAWVQLGVDGHRHRARPPNGIQPHQIVRVVGHEQAHPVAWGHAQLAQSGRPAGAALGPLRPVQHQSMAVQHRVAPGVPLRIARQPMGDVHGRRSPLHFSFMCGSGMLVL